MKKKITMIALIVALVAIMVVGGTLAYFTDTDQAKNTMTIGNVAIEINEYQYGENGWEPYEDKEFVLYPLENEQGNALYNKNVRTKNTSPSKDDVYMRNIVLIEANQENLDLTTCCFDGIHFGYDFAGTTGQPTEYTSSIDGKTHYRSKVETVLEDSVSIGGKEYWVVSFVSESEKPVGYEESLSSLHSVWIDENVKSEQIAGWGDEGEVEILVYSQGIQAEGLTHAEAMEALGEVTAEYVQALYA